MTIIFMKRGGNPSSSSKNKIFNLRFLYNGKWQRFKTAY